MLGMIRAGHIAAIVMLPALLAAAFGQGIGGAILGVVRDPAGRSLPRASVKAVRAANCAQWSAETDDSGAFRFSNLPVGAYVVKVQAAGFRQSSSLPQYVGAGISLRVEIPLELGAVSETLVVTSAPAQTNSEDAQMGRTLTGIEGLPLVSARAGRNVLLLAGTQPGILYPAEEGDFSTNGQRANANNFLLDGVDANNLGSGGTAETPAVISPNALVEFRIVTGAVKAEYGGHSGGTIILTTRSGGSEFHAAASEIFRNTKLNATPFFQNSVPGGDADRMPGTAFPRRPQWNSNDFDVNAGGPVRPERMFFFVSYLGVRQRQGDPRAASVPSESQRSIVEAAGTAEARSLLALIPRASSGNTLFAAPSNSLRRDQGLLKIDRVVSAANRLSAAYLIEDQLAVNQFLRSPAPGFGGATALRFQQAILTDTHTFSADTLQEFRASFHRRADLTSVPANRTGLASLGLNGIVPDDPDVQGPPFLHISGFSDFGNDPNGPRATPRNTLYAVDNISWLRGRHRLKAGGEFLAFAVDILFHRSNSGEITIDGSGTPLYFAPTPGLTPALNDFAHGFAARFQQGSTFRHSLRQQSAALFWQDDWKAAPRLTLNLGLRWQYTSPMTDRHDRFVAFRPGQQSAVFPDAPRGVVYPGDSNVSRSTVSGDWNNFGPRFGFAVDLFGSGRITLRGGAALIYETPSTVASATFMDAPPFSLAPATGSTQFASPWTSARVNPIPQPFPWRAVQPGDRYDFSRIAPIGLGVFDPAFVTPYAMQWDLQTQFQVSPQWMLEIGYVGSRGAHLFNQRSLNPAIPGPGATSGNTDLRRLLNRGGAAVFGQITSFLTDASSSYHSLQTTLSRQLTRGLQTSAAYTWGHAIDNASATNINQPRLVAGLPGGRADRGNSTHDVRHRLVLTGLYERRGWSVSALSTFQTGLPFNILEYDDRCLCDGGNQRPDYIGGPVQFYDPRSTSAVPGVPNAWFDPRSLRRVGMGATWEQGAGRFGTLGRNPFRGPGLNNWDIALARRFRIAERHSVQLRAEFFNAFNHAQFANPGITRTDDPNLGRILQTRDPRLVQLSLRYAF